MDCSQDGSTEAAKATKTILLPFATKLLTMFLDLLRTDTFNNAIKLNESRPSDVLRWIGKEQGQPEAKAIQKVMMERNRARKNKDFRTMFKEEESATLRELGTEQIKQILKVATALLMYERKDNRVFEMYEMVFPAKRVGPSLLVGTRYVTSKCNRNSVEQSGSKFAFTVPKPFEVIMLFHALSYSTDMLKNAWRKGTGGLKTSNLCGNRMGFAVQLIVKAWSSLAVNVGVQNCERLVLPYLLLEKETKQFKALVRRADGFGPLWQQNTLKGSATAAMEEKDVDPIAWGRNEGQDEGFRYVAGMFISHLNELVTSDRLYDCKEKEEWPFLKKYQYELGDVAPVFSSLSAEVKEQVGYKEKPVPVIDVDAVAVDENAGDDVITVEEIVVEENKKAEKKEEEEIPPVVPKRKRKRKDETVEKKRLRESPRLQGMQLVKREEVVVGASGGAKDEEAVPSVSEEEFKQLYEYLQKKMDPYCRVYDVCFRELIETEADLNGEYLDGTMQLILTDPPYTTRIGSNSRNSSHDKLSKTDMADCVKIFARLLKPGGHGIVFCSNLQFQDWYRLLRRVVQDGIGGDPYLADEDEGEGEVGKNGNDEKGAGEGGEGGDDDDDDEDEDDDDAGDSQPFRKKEKKPCRVFEVESVAKTLVKAPGHYFQYPGQKKLSHMSVAEWCVHFWKKGLPLKQALKKAKYENQGHVASRHAAWTNVMDNVPRIADEERVKVPGTNRMVRPEQKNVCVMQEMIEYYTEEGDLVGDLFTGTGASLKGCLRLNKPRRFVGCDSDASCLNIALPSIVKEFAEQLINSKSRIRGSAEDVEKAKRYVSYMNQDVKKTNEEGWKAPPGLPMYQKLPLEATCFLSCGGYDADVVQEQSNKSPDMWPRPLKGLLDTMNVDMLRAGEAAAKGLVVCKSRIKHRFAGKGVIAMRGFTKNETVLTYYGTLVYRNLLSETATTKTYGDGILGIRKGDFCHSAVELNFKVTDGNKKRRPVFIVPAPFCVASYINDPRYLPGDEEESNEGTLLERTANVTFVQSAQPPLNKQLKRNDFVEIVAIRKIRAGEELYMDYGGKYTQWGAKHRRGQQ